jgi:very-short-patch-repair endonuclease
LLSDEEKSGFIVYFKAYNYDIMSDRNRRDIKSARELRKNSTDSEILLWDYLRNRRLSGYKFLRQHPVFYKADRQGLNYFIADFYCDAKKQ